MPVPQGNSDQQVHAVESSPRPCPESTPARETEAAVQPDQPSQMIHQGQRGTDLEFALLGVGAKETLQVEPQQVEHSVFSPGCDGRPYARGQDQWRIPIPEGNRMTESRLCL